MSDETNETPTPERVPLPESQCEPVPVPVTQSPEYLALQHEFESVTMKLNERDATIIDLNEKLAADNDDPPVVVGDDIMTTSELVRLHLATVAERDMLNEAVETFGLQPIRPNAVAPHTKPVPQAHGSLMPTDGRTGRTSVAKS